MRTQLLPPFFADDFKCKLLEITCHVVRGFLHDAAQLCSAIPPRFQALSGLEAQGTKVVRERRNEKWTLYVLFCHFRACDVLVEIFLLFFHKLSVHLHVHKTIVFTRISAASMTKS